MSPVMSMWTIVNVENPTTVYPMRIRPFCRCRKDIGETAGLHAKALFVIDAE